MSLKLKWDDFDWDAGNRHKCEKHGLSVAEIEDFFKGLEFSLLPDIKHSSLEDRMVATGYAKNGKPVFIVFTMREQLLRPVTARYMHAKEAKRYEEKISKA